MTEKDCCTLAFAEWARDTHYPPERYETFHANAGFHAGWQAALAYARQKSGWKLVPVEPTADMVNAGMRPGVGFYETGEITEEMAEACYEAMLAAAPPAPPTAGGGRVMDADEILEQIDAAQAKRRSELPTERDALTAMWRARERLMDFGWNDAKFCPKDGTFFHAIEAGSTGIHVCNYDGEWPKGRWWIYYEGDVYPARPILWRPIKERNNG